MFNVCLSVNLLHGNTCVFTRVPSQAAPLLKPPLPSPPFSRDQKNSSAEASELMIGDIITQIGQEFISGLTPFEAFHKCFGPVGSEVEIVASRFVNGVKGRVSELVVRDQEAPAMRGRNSQKSAV